MREYSLVLQAKHNLYEIRPFILPTWRLKQRQMEFRFLTGRYAHCSLSVHKQMNLFWFLRLLTWEYSHVLQAVHDLYEIRPGQLWEKGEERITKIVLIGTNHTSAAFRFLFLL
jgi:hypothetical protein